MPYNTNTNTNTNTNGAGHASFMNLFVNPAKASDLYVQIPASAIDPEDGGTHAHPLAHSQPFIVTCVAARGAFHQGTRGGVQAALLHEPCESTEYNVFHFKRPSGYNEYNTSAPVRGIDLVREQNQIRIAPDTSSSGSGNSSDSDSDRGSASVGELDGSKPVLSQVAWEGWVSTLPVVATQYHERSGCRRPDTTTTTTGTGTGTGTGT